MAHLTFFLILAACLALPALSQVTFSKSWVPQGKRASPPSGMAATLEVPDSCREAKFAVLTEVSNALMTLIEEVSQEALDENLPALRLKNAFVSRKRRMA
ncbi:uncharacterized protein LOC143023093 [Oratosquilla oratoria]|uniref:uncharacterized protein LOC143023093 n=1 Tax=Oratosquilla oratoria TaxID=337810 RepID=UPI003F7738F4